MALRRPTTLTTLLLPLTDPRATAELVKSLVAAGQKTLADEFNVQFLGMPPNQFGGVTGTIQNALSAFQDPSIAGVFGNEYQRNTIAFGDLERGKVICISLPQIYPQARYALNVMFKHLFYQYALMRYDRSVAELEEANVLALWLDEAQHSLRAGAAGDYRMLDRLRQARCCAILAMQDHTSCYPTLTKDVTVVTLAQLRNRLIYAAPTFDSAEISANFIGKKEVMKVTRGSSGGRSSISRTPTDEFVLKPQDITGLRNHYCHVYLANKTLKKSVRLPEVNPGKGIYPVFT
jgi:type IV secretory pathway TraG/TraD family ATPase VirD4